MNSDDHVYRALLGLISRFSGPMKCRTLGGHYGSNFSFADYHVGDGRIYSDALFRHRILREYPLEIHGPVETCRNKRIENFLMRNGICSCGALNMCHSNENDNARLLLTSLNSRHAS